MITPRRHPVYTRQLRKQERTQSKKTLGKKAGMVCDHSPDDGRAMSVGHDPVVWDVAGVALRKLKVRQLKDLVLHTQAPRLCPALALLLLHVVDETHLRQQRGHVCEVRLFTVRATGSS